MTILGGRIIDQFVHDQTAIAAQSKGGTVGQHDTDGTAMVGFDDVTLINGVTRLHHRRGAVGVAHGDGARILVDDTDLDQTRALGPAFGLGELPRGQRPGQAGHQIGRQHLAVSGGQGMGDGTVEEAGNDDMLAVGQDDFQVGTMTEVIGAAQITTGGKGDDGRPFDRMNDLRLLLGRNVTLASCRNAHAENPQRTPALAATRERLSGTLCQSAHLKTIRLAPDT